MQLYRVVSPAELADIQACGGLRPGLNTFEGKWFAETPGHAMRWGALIYDPAITAYHVIEVEVVDYVADRWFRLLKLDGVGPARYAEEADLSLITFVAEVPLDVIGGP